jgi:hypothetical protein
MPEVISLRHDSAIPLFTALFHNFYHFFVKTFCGYDKNEIQFFLAGKMYSQIRLISTGLQIDGTHSLSLRSIELYGVFYRVPA